MATWEIEFDNDVGNDDGYYVEWWTVSDGKRSFKADTKDDAEWLRDLASQVEALQAQRDELLAALHDAATSLETINRLAGKSSYLGDDGERIPTYMEHHDEVRGYAFSRATVAREAIAKVKA